MKTKNDSQEQQTDANIHIKLETIKWLLSVFGSLIIILLIIKIVGAFYNPDVEASKQIAKDLLISPETAFPEPKERILFVMSVIAGGLSLFGLYSYLTTYFKNKIPKSISSLYTISVAIASLFFLYALYKGLVSKNPFAATPQNSHDVVAKTNLDFYFIKTYLHKNFYLYLLFLYPLLLAFLTNIFKIKEELYIKINKALRFMSLAFALCLIVITCAISTINFPHTFENKYDFNAIYYSVVQVCNGTPMLVNDFTNTYGLYPHFLAPVLNAIGFDVYHFSLIMGLLLSACFSMMYYFMAKQIRNKLLLLFGFTSIFYYSYLHFRVVTNFDTAYATSPIRWLFPCLLLLFSTFYLANLYSGKFSLLFKNNIPLLNKFSISGIKIISFLFFALGILWSPDTGAFSFIALILFYAYQEFDMRNFKNTFIKLLAHIIVATILAIITLKLFMLIVKLGYGTEPDLSLMFNTIKAFASLGLGMLPLPSTWHVWIIVVIVYAFGFMYSISALVKKEITAKSSSVFLLSILGILFFSYYQGRSHNWNLLIINFPVFMLLAIFCDDLIRIYKSKNTLLAPFAVSLFLISFSVFQIIGGKESMLELVGETKNQKTNFNEHQVIKANSAVIDSLSENGEKVFILSATQYQALYHSLSKTASAINPGFVELFTVESYNNILNKIKNNNIKVFFEPNQYRFSNLKIQAVLSALYDVKQEFNKGSLLWYLQKKENKSKETTVFNTTENLVLHELFSNNVSTKYDYALGNKGTLTLDSVFSIEIIFKPQLLSKNPYTNGATLLSNANNEKGFVLQQSNDNPNQYVFVTNNQGIICPINPTITTYLAIQVNSKKMIAYVNGLKIGEVSLAKPYLNSNSPLFIGNFNAMGGFFFGDINEVFIRNGILNETLVNQNFEKLNTK